MGDFTLIKTRLNHSIDSARDVILIPPGSINVTGDDDLFALRFNAADLTGTLNGTLGARSKEGDAACILFQDDSDTPLNGNLIFSSGKVKLSATGVENVCDIGGDELTIGGKTNTPLTGSMKATAKSRTTATAVGIDTDVELQTALGLSINVKADASKGTGATACGISGDVDGSGTSDRLRMKVTSKTGLGTVLASGFGGDFIVNGVLAGALAVSAYAAKKGASAEADGFAGTVSDFSGISRKFKMKVTAKAKGGEATACGFGAFLADSGAVLAGTVTVMADASGGTDASAYGVYNAALGFGATDSKFKCAVTAKSGSGAASAWGFWSLDIEQGLAGTVSVTAQTRSGAAQATGCGIFEGEVFRTRSGGVMTVTAKARSSRSVSVACGLSGESGEIDLAGRLAVTGSGGNYNSATGVSAANALIGTISGAVGVVGMHATGVSGGDDSILAVSGAIYAATKGNAAGVAKSLEKSIGKHKSVASKSKNAAQAVTLGASSTLTLTDGGIVIGEVTQGDNSTLNLSSGAQLYGDIDMGAGSNLSITIDGTLKKAAMVTLSSDGAGVFAPDSGVNLSITVTAATQAGSYVLLAGSDLSELASVDFNTLFNLAGFDTYGLQANWELELGKTDTLKLVLSEAPVDLLGATDFNSADRMLAAPSLTDAVAATHTGVWKNAFLA